MSFGRRRGGAFDEVGWRPPTTMLDVIFLILTFFITIASFREDDRQIDVSLPATEADQAPAGPRSQMVITVSSEGRIFMGDREYAPDDLRGTLVQLAAQYPGESMVIRGDRDSKLGTTVWVMDACYAAGLRNVFLATTKPESDVGR